MIFNQKLFKIEEKTKAVPDSLTASCHIYYVHHWPNWASWPCILVLMIMMKVRYHVSTRFNCSQDWWWLNGTQNHLHCGKTSCMGLLWMKSSHILSRSLLDVKLSLFTAQPSGSLCPSHDSCSDCCNTHTWNHSMSSMERFLQCDVTMEEKWSLIRARQWSGCCLPPSPAFASIPPTADGKQTQVYPARVVTRAQSYADSQFRKMCNWFQETLVYKLVN